MNKLWIALAAGMVAAQAHAVKLALELDGLEPMRGQHYEGWNIIDGKPYTTGRFSISRDGGVYLVNADGKKLARIGKDNRAKFKLAERHSRSTLFVLTIEPNGDEDDGPSSVHVLGGKYTSGKAELTVDHGSALGNDFSGADGSFILAAPTGDEANQGLWFVDPAAGNGSLVLPTLPAGWAYEGWIVNTRNDRKFSTGLFQKVTGPDSDGAGRLAGPLKLSFPPVPGQDIVRSKVVLDDGIHAAVITIEPYPDFDPAPYVLKVLKREISSGAPGMTPLKFENVSESLVTGRAHLH